MRAMETLLSMQIWHSDGAPAAPPLLSVDAAAAAAAEAVQEDSEVAVAAAVWHDAASSPCSLAGSGSSMSNHFRLPSLKKPSQQPVRWHTARMLSVALFPRVSFGSSAMVAFRRISCFSTTTALTWADCVSLSPDSAPRSSPASCSNPKTRLSFKYGLGGSEVRLPGLPDNNISRKMPGNCCFKRTTMAVAARFSALDLKKDLGSVG
mmetsp:Transcript_21162/g.38627  ORF Transcript_21162/g.38627 Transcript_21162/m.38627 type:complete len:207 (-) Transcript_21162:1620-2240(-)